MVYGFGALGLAWPATRSFFLFFTPFTLLFGAMHLLWFEEQRGQARFWWSMLGVWLAGFAIEWAGVATGLIFGEYSYGTVLGPKLMGVPLVIGINWTILIYAAASLAHMTGVSRWLRPFLGATIVTLTDVFIEPVAVYYEFWTWVQPPFDALFVAPWQNYLAWWLFSLVVLAAFEGVNFTNRNAALLRYWLFQLGFFVLLNILI
jgi:putative membrane protein